MRSSLLACLAAVVIGCASAPAPRSTEAEVVQFVVAAQACLPIWFREAPTLEIESLRLVTTLVAIEDLRDRALAPYQCVLDAGSDCARVRACYGLRSEATSGPCMGAVPQCDGDTLVVCVRANDPFPTQLGRVDCTEEGLICEEVDAGGMATAGCAPRPCTGDASRCEGRVAVFCRRGLELREEAEPGTACTTSGGFAHFVLTGAPCTADRCEGNVAVDCDLGTGHVSSALDCSVLGRVCDASFSQCREPPGGCIAVGEPQCDSPTRIRYCGTNGDAHLYDCVAAGFSGCEERLVPPRRVAIASCAPSGPRF